MWVKSKAFSASPELEFFDPCPPCLPIPPTPEDSQRPEGLPLMESQCSPIRTCLGPFQSPAGPFRLLALPPWAVCSHPHPCPPRGPWVSPPSPVFCLNHLLRPDYSFMSTACLFFRDTSPTPRPGQGPSPPSYPTRRSLDPISKLPSVGGSLLRVSPWRGISERRGG